MDEKQDFIKKRWILLLSIVSVQFFAVAYFAIDYVAKNLLFSNSKNSTSYAVIMDAGSSATKMHVYTFRGTRILRLESEFFAKVVPGLNQYAETPEALKEPLEQLLEKARAAIPKSKWADTPVLLRATAGLRMITWHQAQVLLEECRKIFKKSGFAAVNGSADLMDASDEGIYSWVTINFLLGKFKTGGDWKNTVSLDLGGASTQVTFARSKANFEMEHSKNFYNFSIFGRDMEIYSRSVLGLGVDAARRAILCYPNQCPKDESSNKVYSDCIGSSENIEWMYSHKQYLIRGNSTRNEESFLKCLETVKKVINETMEGGLPSLTDRDIYAISFYDNLATQVSNMAKTDNNRQFP